MYILYLDQNKWIELAAALKRPIEFPELILLANNIVRLVEVGKLLVPLSATNIYETQKRRDVGSRSDIALVQSKLSKGLVFRGRYKRLEVEITNAMLNVSRKPQPTMRDFWFLSDLPFEAFTEKDDERLGFIIPDHLAESFRKDSPYSTYHYLVSMEEDDRSTAVAEWSRQSVELCQRVEQRRAYMKGESFIRRREVYNGFAIIDEIAFLNQVKLAVEDKWGLVIERDRKTILSIYECVPTWYVERELAIRLEDLSRKIEENDFRDMAAFCATIPYADAVVGENLFVNLARQSRLGTKYQTELKTHLLDLEPILATL